MRALLQEDMAATGVESVVLVAWCNKIAIASTKSSSGGPTVCPRPHASRSPRLWQGDAPPLRRAARRPPTVPLVLRAAAGSRGWCYSFSERKQLSCASAESRAFLGKDIHARGYLKRTNACARLLAIAPRQVENASLHLISIQTMNPEGRHKKHVLQKRGKKQFWSDCSANNLHPVCDTPRKSKAKQCTVEEHCALESCIAMYLIDVCPEHEGPSPFVLCQQADTSQSAAQDTRQHRT